MVLLLKNNDIYDYVFQYSVKTLTEHPSNASALWGNTVVINKLLVSHKYLVLRNVF